MKITCVGVILLVFLASTLAMPSKYADQDKEKLKNAYLQYLMGKWLFSLCIRPCVAITSNGIKNYSVIGEIESPGLCYPVSTMCFTSYYDSPSWNACCSGGGSSWQEHLFAPCYRW